MVLPSQPCKRCWHTPGAAARTQPKPRCSPTQAVQKAMRADGRQPLEARDLEVETDILVQCWGSARCVVGGGLGGGTECLAAVTAQVGEGTACVIEVECSPSLWASGDDRLKLARQERLSREADAWLRTWRASIPKIGEKLGWHLVVDCIILSDDGGLREALSCAVRAALASTKLPAAEEALEASDETTEALPFSLLPAETPPTTLSVDECPVVVTLAVVGGTLVADTTADEPADAMLAVAVAGGAVVGVDVLCGAVPPALLREAVAAAPALAAPLLGASSLTPAPR